MILTLLKRQFYHNRKKLNTKFTLVVEIVEIYLAKLIFNLKTDCAKNTNLVNFGLNIWQGSWPSVMKNGLLLNLTKTEWQKSDWKSRK